jgi:hypothetical protein
MTGMEQMLKAMGVDPEGLKIFANSLKTGLDRMEIRLLNIEAFMARMELLMLDLRDELNPDAAAAGGTYHDLVSLATPEKSQERGNG